MLFDERCLGLISSGLYVKLMTDNRPTRSFRCRPANYFKFRISVKSEVVEMNFPAFSDGEERTRWRH